MQENDELRNTTMQKNELLAWRPTLMVITESLLAFYIASFSIGMYILHRGSHWITGAIFLGILYVFVTITCVVRVLKHFPMEAIMLITPLAPLIALIIIVTLIPVLQWFA